MKGAEAFTTNMASGSISSISAGMQWDANGNYTGFDNEAYNNAFINSMVGEGAMRGYFSRMIQTGIGSTMNYGFEGEFKGLLNDKLGDSQAFKSVVTNGLTAGAELAMFGDTSINVLNTSMFGLPGSQGLLSLNLSGDGIKASIGGGGLDLNLGNMWKAGRVGSIFDQNNAMEESGFDAEELVAGRVLWSAGIDQTSKLLGELMSGDAVLNRDTLSDRVAKTTLTGGVKQIDLSKITEGDIGLMLGIILSHEAMRDGVEGTQQEQAIETFRSVLTHSVVAQMVGNTYGMASLDASVVEDIKALQTGDMDVFARYALGKFDGKEDNWKVTKEGNVVFDGSKNLYDENGKLLKEYGGTGGYTDSLASVLGIGSAEAGNMMIGAGWTYGNGTFTTDGGTNNVLNNTDFVLNTSANFKARYDIQMNVLDKVWSDHNGDMVSAISSSMNEIDLARSSGNLTENIIQKYQVLTGLKVFAQSWNDAMYGSDGKPGNWDTARAEDYKNRNVEGEFEKIFDDFAAGKLDNSNYLYSAVNNTIFPIEGDTEITTTAFYGYSQFEKDNGIAGKPHGQRRGGLGIDLGSAGENYPLYTTQPENFLFGTALRNGEKTGYNFTSYSDNFRKISMHMLQGNIPSSVLQDIDTLGKNSRLFRTTLPVGYNYGQVGTSGFSSSEHLHWELIPYYY